MRFSAGVTCSRFSMVVIENTGYISFGFEYKQGEQEFVSLVQLNHPSQKNGTVLCVAHTGPRWSEKNYSPLDHKTNSTRLPLPSTFEAASVLTVAWDNVESAFHFYVDGRAIGKLPNTQPFTTGPVNGNGTYSSFRPLVMASAACTVELCPHPFGIGDMF